MIHWISYCIDQLFHHLNFQIIYSFKSWNYPSNNQFVSHESILFTLLKPVNCSDVYDPDTSSDNRGVHTCDPVHVIVLHSCIIKMLIHSLQLCTTDLTTVYSSWKTLWGHFSVHWDPNEWTSTVFFHHRLIGVKRMLLIVQPGSWRDGQSMSISLFSPTPAPPLCSSTSPQTRLIFSSHAAQSSYGQLTQQRQIKEKLIPLIHCKGLLSVNQISRYQILPDDDINKCNLWGPLYCTCSSQCGLHLTAGQRDKMVLLPLWCSPILKLIHSISDGLHHLSAIVSQPKHGEQMNQCWHNYSINWWVCQKKTTVLVNSSFKSLIKQRCQTSLI